MVRSKSKSFDFITTPDHRWAKRVGTTSPDNGAFALEPLRNKQQQAYVILSAQFDHPTLDITEDEAALIAWVLTDGSCAKYKNGWHASIQQSKFVEEVRQLLNRLSMPNMGHVYTSEVIVDGCHRWNLKQPYFVNLLKRAGLYLDKKRGDVKFDGWEQFILGLSANVRESFCTHGYLAEGSTSSKQVRWRDGNLHDPKMNKFHQSLGPINDAFRLAYFLSGKYPTVQKAGDKGAEQFLISEPRKWTRTIVTTEIPEPRPVWCPTTALGTWVMRQNRQIVITGNSYCWALRKRMGLNIRGFMYHEQRKGFPEPPTENKVVRLGRRYSVNQNQTTDYDIFLNTVRSFDTSAYEIGLYDQFLHFLKNEGIQYYRRVPVVKGDYELDQIEKNLLMEVREMLDPNLQIYPSPGRFACQNCAFQVPCISKNVGQDYQYTLSTLFEKQPPHYVRTKQRPSTESKGGE